MHRVILLPIASSTNHFPITMTCPTFFGKDHATKACTETFADVGSNVPGGFEGFPIDDAKDPEIPMMYSQRLDILLDMRSWGHDQVDWVREGMLQVKARGSEEDKWLKLSTLFAM